MAKYRDYRGLLLQVKYALRDCEYVVAYQLVLDILIDMEDYNKESRKYKTKK